MNDLSRLPNFNALGNSSSVHPLISKVKNPDIKVHRSHFDVTKTNIIAGPCSVESEEMIHQVASNLKQQGIKLLRGGAYKPSTSPYGFQGWGEVALRWLKDVKNSYDLGIVTEILNISHLDSILGCADMLQVGARNMQNYELLKELGKCKKPVLLKRGMSAKIEEWLLAAEYILKEGNDQIIFCERGIRTFETYTRNTLDLSAVPLLKELVSFPIIVDPSHGTGRRSLVRSMSLAALTAGADGLLIEVHPNPNQALKDGAQSIDFNELELLMNDIDRLSDFLERKIY